MMGNSLKKTFSAKAVHGNDKVRLRNCYLQVEGEVVVQRLSHIWFHKALQGFSISSDYDGLLKWQKYKPNLVGHYKYINLNEQW